MWKRWSVLSTRRRPSPWLWNLRGPSDSLSFKLYSTAASLHKAGELQTSSCCNQSVFVARPLLTIIFIISLPALRFMRDFLQFSTSQQQPGYLLRSDNFVQLSFSGNNFIFWRCKRAKHWYMYVVFTKRTEKNSFDPFFYSSLFTLN